MSLRDDYRNLISTAFAGEIGALPWEDGAAGGTGRAVAAGTSCTFDTSLSCTPGNAVAAGVSCTFDVAISCTPGDAVADGIDCDIEEGGDVTLNCAPGNAVAAGVSCTIDIVSQPTQSQGGTGGGGARHRVRQSREFNDFIESLFKKKSRKQVLQTVVEKAVDEEKLRQNIEFVAEAFRQKHVQRDSALRTELELVETQLRRKLQDLEDEEYAVVSLLL